MTQGRKYANLPDLDTAPDIYETPELTEDNSTIPPTATARSTSPTSSQADSDDEQSGITRRRLQTDQARTHFQPARVDARGVNFSDNISQQRQAYRTSSRRQRRRTGEVLGDDSDEEVFKDKLARLKREVAELENEYEKKKQEGDKSVEEPDVEKYINNLSTSIDSVYTKRRGGVKGAEAILQRSINKYQAISDKTKAANKPEEAEKKAPAPVDQLSRSQLALVMKKAAEFDQRMDTLEKALGLNGSNMPDIGEKPPFPVLFTLDKLEKTLKTVSEASSSNLDTASQSVKKLIQEADQLKEHRKSVDIEESDSGAVIAQGTGDSKDPREAERVSKINALFGTLSTIDELAPLLPLTLERLRTLRLVHASALQASNTLDVLEARQAQQEKEIKQWRQSLVYTEVNLKDEERKLTNNMKVIGDWVKNLDGRLDKL